MHLYLTSATPWEAKYCTEEGQAIYKIDSPASSILSTSRNMKISRIVPPVIDPNATSVDDSALRDTFDLVGEVDYHLYGDSHIKYGGKDEKSTSFFRKGAVSGLGRDRIFQGSDGKEYVWKLAARSCNLFVNDTAHTPVASFHRRQVKIFGHTRPASFEIFPEGEHMADLIMVTFAYVEKLSLDRERGAS